MRSVATTATTRCTTIPFVVSRKRTSCWWPWGLFVPWSSLLPSASFSAGVTTCRISSSGSSHAGSLACKSLQPTTLPAPSQRSTLILTFPFPYTRNDYMKKGKMAGPYVDPSFYSGEPFWTSEGSEFSHYPLRPMPPRIFYPVPAKMDMRRWSNQRQLTNGQTPLFVLASRQFTRNPYSARPNERGSASSSIR